MQARAEPHLRDIALDLLAHLDGPDPKTYALYFESGVPEATRRGLPWRAGYYVGLLVAQDLARSQSFEGLAHLRGPPLEALIRDSLTRLAQAPSPGRP